MCKQYPSAIKKTKKENEEKQVTMFTIGRFV